MCAIGAFDFEGDGFGVFGLGLIVVFTDGYAAGCDRWWLGGWGWWDVGRCGDVVQGGSQGGTCCFLGWFFESWEGRAVSLCCWVFPIRILGEVRV